MARMTGNRVEEPDQPYVNEITQSLTRVNLSEYLRMIQIVSEYMKEYVLPEVNLEPDWTSGYALINEINVSKSEEEVHRSEIEMFYQEKLSGIKKLAYTITLIRFSEDQWRVFQVKEKTNR